MTSGPLVYFLSRYVRGLFSKYSAFHFLFGIIDNMKVVKK